MPTQEQVLEALKTVKFPGLSRDIVSFGFVRDVDVSGGRVAFTVHFQTENPTVGATLKRDAEAAVRKIAGVTDLDVAGRQSGMPQGAAAPAQLLENVRFKIAVASGKGGVGKSTVSTNLALS